MDPDKGASEAKDGAQVADAASVRVVGLSGSMIAGGSTQKAVSHVLGGAAEYGVTTKLIGLSDYALVFCGAVPGLSTIGKRTHKRPLQLDPDGNRYY